MSHAVYCAECDETVWPPIEATGSGGQTEISACHMALEHMRKTEHTTVYVNAGCYFTGDGERPTEFGEGGVHPDDVRCPDKSKMAAAVAGAARRLRDSADTLEKHGETWGIGRTARFLREYADAVESNIPDDQDDARYRNPPKFYGVEGVPGIGGDDVEQ